ncbi:hypothetical protein B5C26_08375 [Photorhabdus luminescens]|uniref:hypothetical protein n=1 Tax=Photorhabdus luminescens TaxID=29488 RepID=UPI000B4CC82F|nr:hypothetical protein [Photorhabdus luminescens]OWO82999.1 hypothetical protein B5C26_08375 [Photorhabdus luminescens]
MNLTDLRKLILNSGFTFKELIKIKRNFITLYKDEPDIYDKYQSKIDCFCHYLLFRGEEVAMPIIYSTLISSFIMLGMLFSGKAYGIPLMFFVYLLTTVSFLFLFGHSINLITELKLSILYFRFKIKTKFQSS